MGQNPMIKREEDERVPDTVISNALILDYTGIYKADIAIRDGNIAAIVKAGNPLVQDNVDIIIGATTQVISGEGRMVTAGAIDTHVHFINPDQFDVALSNGTTTLIGGGAGPGAGSRATTATPGPWHIESMIQALEDAPINVGLTG